MDRKELTQTVKEMIAAPSCCQELKAAGEKAAAAARLQELREDVLKIDQVIEFFESPQAKQIFGVEQAKAMAEHAHAVKAAGGKWCDCPACTAGLKILDNASLLA